MAKDQNELLEIIKKAALSAVEATKPVNVCFGTVTEDSPLKILVDQKLLLGENQLILARNVTDFETTITMSSADGWATEDRSGGSGYAAFSSHNHNINMTKKKITVHNGLVKGDSVIMIRQQGGQKYIVVDRLA